MSIPFLSVIMPVYNAWGGVDHAIQSILGQTYRDFELIIINDGSTDNSKTIIKSFADSRIKYFENEKNLGIVFSRNKGLKNATGDYIMRVDPYDIVLKYRIGVHVDFLEKNKDFDVVDSNVIYFHNETKGEVFRSNFPVEHQSIQSTYKKGEHGVQYSSTMIRASVMKKYKYMQENNKIEDYEIFARLIKGDHRFANIAESITRMPIHGQSASSNIRFKIIKRTYDIRDRILEVSTHPLKIHFYYWYILNYRKFFITQHKVMNPFYLTLSVMFYPSKLLKSIF